MAAGQILGFDAREMWLNPGEVWADARRDDYLLRLDVVKPLSVDYEVWPSVFGANSCLGRPDWTGGIQDLWENLERLEAYLDNEWEHPKACWLVAVTLVKEGSEGSGQEQWTDRIDVTEPAICDNSWTFLGYDVGDAYLLSALANLGLSPGMEDVNSLRAEWSPRLNEFHLFSEVEDARKFVRLSNERAKEHAPFFVFGLWLVRKR